MNNTLSHEIAAILRDEILRERYRSGERLPSERDLAARFSASRGAVREALSQLEQLGLIQVQPGGARVQPIDAASIGVLGHLMAIDETPDPELVDQFLQTFAALACVTARAAMNKADAAQIQSLQGLSRELASEEQGCDVMQPQWRVLLEALSDIGNNLVVRLIGNDLRDQFVEQIFALGVKPRLDREALHRILGLLDQGLSLRDAELLSAALQGYFDALRDAMTMALEERRGHLRRQAV